jgi:glycosyltransferase involved in cell wall biosynthesis
MVTESSPISAGESFAQDVSARGPVRVGLVSDLLEENWPSMDVMSDMLASELEAFDPAAIAPVQLRPPMHRRFARTPGIGNLAALKNADRLLNRFADYPRWLRPRMKDFDLFHLIDHSYSQLLHTLPAARTVVTCHDMDTFKCLLEPRLEPRPAWFRTMAQRILDGFRQAAHVICNSAATRDQILHYGLLPADRLTVIHVGLSPVFNMSADPEADREAASLFGPESPGEIRLLSVGSTIPRKRMDILLRVFAALRGDLPGARLIRVGGSFTEAQHGLARDLDLLDSISVLPFVTTPVLAAIYRRSALLLQPSESEGFGMPLTEALACGCPVLASDIASLREVGGSAIEYQPVGDVEAWKTAAVRILNAHADAGRSAEFRRNAAQHAARYSWRENARETVQVYARVLASLGRPLELSQERL